MTNALKGVIKYLASSRTFRIYPSPIGGNLRKLREQLGLTVDDAAEKLGVTRNLLETLEMTHASLNAYFQAHLSEKHRDDVRRILEAFDEDRFTNIPFPLLCRFREVYGADFADLLNEPAVGRRAAMSGEILDRVEKYSRDRIHLKPFQTIQLLRKLNDGRLAARNLTDEALDKLIDPE